MPPARQRNSSNQNSNIPPYTVQIHPNDNVAIVANTGGLPEETMLPNGLVLLDQVLMGHQVSTVALTCATRFERFNLLTPTVVT